MRVPSFTRPITRRRLRTLRLNISKLHTGQRGLSVSSEIRTHDSFFAPFVNAVPRFRNDILFI